MSTAVLTPMSPTTTTPESPVHGDRIDNAPLRAAFERSGVSAGLVAFRCDWTYRRNGRQVPDCSRVKRALGLMPMRGGHNRRPVVCRTIGVELAAAIAHAIGADLRDVGA